ncbi:zinc finger BED domain-containing protein DAYSLEEPER-like protein [Tanacetum coccineum]
MTLDSEAPNELHNITHRLRKTESIFKSHLLTQVNNDEEFATFLVNMTCDEYVEVAEILRYLRCLPLPQMDTSPTESYAPIKIEMQPEYVDTPMNNVVTEPQTRKKTERLLKVVMEPYPESDSAFTNTVSACLSDGTIKSLFFGHAKPKPTFEGNHYQWSQNIVQEALQVCEETVKKVRNCVKYVKTSEPIEDYFLGLKQQLQVLNTRNLSLDDQTKWNTTYEMLLAPSRLKILIFDTASLLASSSVAPANTFFDKIWMLHVELTCASRSEDNIISTITKPMLEGLDKYWKSSCLVLAIAVVMDPQFKMKFVDFMFAKIFGDEAAFFINIVDERIHGLFLEIEFDVNGWWKLNESKYPVLSKIACDILTLPVSTIDPESVFDTCVKEMDQYQCTLRPEMVEALYCVVNR